MTINISVLGSFAKTSGLRATLLRGAAWTTMGFAGAQAMRLASNLLMTRLLAPEHFGLMAIVTVVMVGLSMFSDIGLGPGVIRSPKICNDDFLNTAWTMQIIRGVLLQGACIAIAVPAAKFYGEPQLAYLLPAAGVSVLISALSPMQIYTLQRSMAIGRIVSIELVAQAVALAAMVCVAYLLKSVWVLIFGGLVATSVRLTMQWLALPGHRHRLKLVGEDVRSLVRFGGWIFVSSLLAFAANSAGSLVLGKLATMEKVGLFAIASTLAKSAEQFYDQISTRVLFPIYATLATSTSAEIRQRIFKIRLAIVAAFAPAMCAAAYFAESIVSTLFDNRYGQAAWMFQVVLMGLVPSVICSTLPLLIARGSSVLGAWFSGGRLFTFLATVSVGYYFFGDSGAIVGIACVPCLMYLPDYFVQRAHGLSDFRIDAAALVLWLSTALLIWTTRHG